MKKVVENHGNVSKSMREAGYSAKSAKNPKNLTESSAWEKLMKKYLPDEMLAETHHQLTRSMRVEHMVFPLGPEGEDDINMSGGRKKKPKKEKRETDELEDQPGGGALLRRGGEEEERTTLTDKQIIKMLAEVGCTVKQIVHGNTARHVYFWAPDSKSRKDGLDMAYKLKGKYASDKNTAKIIEKIDKVTFEFPE